jgi:hypothetical protein
MFTRQCGGDACAQRADRSDTIPFRSKTIRVGEIVGRRSGPGGWIRHEGLVEMPASGAKDGYRNRS